MNIELDTDVCMAGWGPEAHGPSGWRVGHYCRRPIGHDGRHVCVMCRSWHRTQEIQLAPIDVDFWRKLCSDVLDGYEPDQISPQHSPNERYRDRCEALLAALDDENQH